MNKNISIANIEDVADLVKLVNSAYRGEGAKQGWTTEADLLDGSRIDETALMELIQTQGVYILKFVEDNTTLGCVELKTIDKSLYLGMLTVRPHLQGKGIGKSLLMAAEELAQKDQCEKIFMTVISVRTELINWYQRHGYTDTGKRKSFDFNDPRFGVPKQKLEFAVLEKQLLSPPN